jgi:hypothetical protein
LPHLSRELLGAIIFSNLPCRPIAFACAFRNLPRRPRYLFANAPTSSLLKPVGLEFIALMAIAASLP